VGDGAPDIIGDAMSFTGRVLNYGKTSECKCAFHDDCTFQSDSGGR